jgi:uncharacterized protein (TIGR02284 family)
MERDDVIECLNDLIETTKDGEYGFRTSAEQAKDPQLKQLFARRADECRTSATELQQLVGSLGGEAEERGSATGAVHRGWVAVKAKLSSYDDLAVLEDVERGEDEALASYRDAVKHDLPPMVAEVVQRQYDGVKRNHDQIRNLRDKARAAAEGGRMSDA